MKSNKSSTVNLKKSLIIGTKKIISEIEKIKREKFSISTGSKIIDDVIGGGFHPNKTYIDTENRVRPERIKVLA